MRFVTVVVVTHSDKFTIKERIFMGVCWMGKATVQAAIAPALLSAIQPYESNANYNEYHVYGNRI